MFYLCLKSATFSDAHTRNAMRRSKRSGFYRGRENIHVFSFKQVGHNPPFDVLSPIWWSIDHIIHLVYYPNGPNFRVLRFAWANKLCASKCSEGVIWVNVHRKTLFRKKNARVIFCTRMFKILVRFVNTQ